MLNHHRLLIIKVLIYLNLIFQSEKFFWSLFDIEKGYSDENDEEMYRYVVLTHVEYKCLDDLCHLVNIDMEDYLPMYHFLLYNSDHYITY